MNGRENLKENGAPMGHVKLNNTVESPKNIKFCKTVTQEITFTTQPKTSRRVRQFPSRTTCKDFMRYLWDRGLRKTCSYDTLEFEFTQFTGTNDTRTVIRYIGRPPQKKETSGIAEIHRQNLSSSNIALFRYRNTLRLMRKIGLMETLGLIAFYEHHVYKKKEWRVLLHHETQPYFTEQQQLPPTPPLNNIDEGLECSKDTVCVLPLPRENRVKPMKVLECGSKGEIDNK